MIGWNPGQLDPSELGGRTRNRDQQLVDHAADADDPFVAGGPTGASVGVSFGSAVLANGTVCFSLHPWDYADL